MWNAPTKQLCSASRDRIFKDLVSLIALSSLSSCVLVMEHAGSGGSKSADSTTPSTTIELKLGQSDLFQLSDNYDAASQAEIFLNDDEILSVGFAENDTTQLHWVVRSRADKNSNWVTNDNFQLDVGWDAMANGVAQDSTGVVWVVGQAMDSTGVLHWIVRKRDLFGVWSTVSNYQLNPGSNASAQSIVVDASDNLYVSGYATDASNTQKAVVRKYTSATTTWATVDSYQAVAGNDAYSLGLAIDPSTGDVLSVGFSQEAGVNYWVSRKLSSGSWSTSEHIQYVAGKDSAATAAAYSPSGTLVVTGMGVDSSDSDHWVVRKYAGSWSTVDDYQLASNHSAVARMIAMLDDQSFYVVGTAENSSSISTGLIRMSADAGVTWTNDVELAGGQDISVSTLAVGSLNQMALSGSAKDTDGDYNWISWVIE